MPCTAGEVVKACTGFVLDDKRSRTLTQIANEVMRVPSSVIATIGEVCNYEYPDICFSSSRNKSSAKTRKQIMSRIDFQFFRYMVNISCLKSSKDFMKAEGPDGERPHICTIYHGKELYKEKKCKPVGHEDITKLYRLSL